MSKIYKYNDKEMNIIGRKLKDIMDSKKISYSELATKLELLGIIICKQSVYDIIRNKRTVKDYELLGISKALNIEIEDFFDIKE